MDNVMVEASHDQYNTRSDEFLVWCYKHHRSIVNTELGAEIGGVMADDDGNETKLLCQTVMYR